MDAGSAGRPFRLVRYFTVASLAAFALVAVALFLLERAESDFFAGAQREQGAFFAAAQADLVHAQKEASRNNLLAQHEAGHLTLATVLANALWDAHFAPLVDAAARMDLAPCRSRGTREERGACFSALGQSLRGQPRFAAADAAVHATIGRSTVFKIKVYDLRGLTVYSSEVAQVGEDKADNAGWRTAVAGKPASELVHRDRFSAFEGVVLNRDLIQSYVPVFAADGGTVRGVFEIYSDVTPLLAQVDALSQAIGRSAAAKEASLRDVAQSRQREVDSASARHFAILAAIMAALYVALLVLVRYAQGIIDAQANARELAVQREHAAHREKMAALATMAANASHEIGNPLAVICGVADDLPADAEGRERAAATIREQAARIAAMARDITEFSTARSQSREPVDVNPMVDGVCRFLAFDDRYRRAQVETRLSEGLPAAMAVPEHLKEVLMGLMEAHVEAGMRAVPDGPRLTVTTEPAGREVAIAITCGNPDCCRACGLPDGDPRRDAVGRLVGGMGGRLEATGDATRVLLPVAGAAT